jgi:hypothetical protein
LARQNKTVYDVDKGTLLPQQEATRIVEISDQIDELLAA